MTACKDSQATSGKKAVSATLAGVLAVGLVPAVALADEAVEVTEEDGITERNTTAEAIMNGTIVLKAGQTAGQEFPASAAPNNYLVPTGVQPQGTTGASNQVKDLGTGNGWFYVPVSASGANTNFVDQDGKALKLDWANKVAADAVPSDGIDAGEWALVAAVTASGDAVVKQALTFTAQATSLANATLYEVKADATDFSDTTFTYDGAAWAFGAAEGDLNLVLDGKKLASGTDYTAKIYNSQGVDITATGPKYAGTYRVVIDGVASSAYAGDKQIEKSLTIAPLNLSSAKVYYKAQQVPTTGAVTEGSILADTTTVNDLTLEDLGLAVGTAPNIDYYIQPSSLTTKTVGGYAVTFTPDIPSTADNAAALAGSFTGTASGTLYVTSEADLAATNFEFDGTEIGKTGADDITIDYSAKKPTAPIYNKWDSSLIEVTDAAGEALDSSVYTIQVLDSEGNDVGVAGLANKGSYKLSVVIDPANTDPAYAFAGKSATMDVTVTYGEVKGANIAFTADGKLLDGATPSVEYTGSPIVIGTNVKFDGKDVPASEYTVAITKDGKAVDQVLDAGTYTITVKSDKYSFEAAGNVITLTVSPMAVTPVDAKDSVKVNYSGTTYPTLFYTGSDIAPTFTFENADGDKVEVPADSYSMSYEYAEKQGDAATGPFKAVDAINEAGTYKVTLADASNKDNYSVQASTPNPFILVVNDGDVFIDVPADAWYSTPVYKAVELDYMNGYAWSQTFGPNDRITRGQVACVLYNMAGGNDLEFNPGYDENKGVVTGFSDVDGHMYYAKPIAWAKQMGVINGFAGTDQFGPDQNITREQFAAMLANYAKKAGKFTDVDVAAVLASMPDGSAVSDWARESVAWAVQAKVMGNGGVIDPMNQISRAETAAMAVNYQPERPDTIIK